ncbi:hypothetical protein HY285_05230 [Candidatus Peregrinibacteria bacterium]|nr:hypothetical protein [Candidatus Peregrinibacteria bacterium]MBI3816914.1 hypothetical protein [Candidatus Peregrinibacteria bacterium]
MDITRTPTGPGAHYDYYGNLPDHAFSPADSRLIREELQSGDAINVYAMGRDKIAVIFSTWGKNGTHTVYRWMLNADGSVFGFHHVLPTGEEPQIEVGDVLQRVGLARVQRELQQIWGISLDVHTAIEASLKRGSADLEGSYLRAA